MSIDNQAQSRFLGNKKWYKVNLINSLNDIEFSLTSKDNKGNFNNMHFNVVVKFAALTVLLFNTGLVAAAPTDSSDHDTDPNPGFQGQVAFVNSWAEAGFTRYRFNFTGVDGDVFKSAFQNCGGITYNWQSYTQDGHGVFDDSELVGSAGTKVITCGIQDVTGVALDCDSISENQC